MSLRLSIYPVLDYALEEGLRFYPNTRLQFRRDYQLFSQIEGFPDECGSSAPPESVPAVKVSVHPLPKGVTVAFATDEGYDYSSTSPITGKPMVWASAGNLARLDNPHGGSVNRAVLAFLAGIHPDTVVILCWE
jgi:hypothetical protein